MTVIVTDKNDDIEVKLLDTEEGQGVIVFITVPSEALTQRTIMDLADEYNEVHFSRAKFHHGKWHATGTVR